MPPPPTHYHPSYKPVSITTHAGAEETNVRDILNPRILQICNDIVRQLNTYKLRPISLEGIAHRSRHFDSICPRNVSLQPLPARNPARRRIAQGNQALEDLRGAFLDGVVVAAEAENVIAVWAAFAHEFLAIRKNVISGSGRGLRRVGRTLCSWTREQTMQARRVRCWLGAT